MPDPFTLLGVVGASAGLLGFLTSNIEKLVDTVDNAAQCHMRLRAMHRTVCSCDKRLKLWRKKCGALAFQEPTASQIWSPVGWREVQEHLDCIADEDSQLRKLLYGETLSLKTRYDFETVQSAMEQRFASDLETKGFLGSLAFALFRSNLVKKSVERLKTLVDELDYLYQWYLVPSTTDPRRTVKILDHTTKQKDFALYVGKGAAKFCAALAAVHRIVKGDWALVMSPPAEENGGRTENEDLEVTFLFPSDGYITNGKCQKISTWYHLSGDGKDGEEILAGVMLSTDTSTLTGQDAVLQETLKRIFHLMIVQSGDVRRLWHKKTSLDRARSALCVARWTTLAWPIDWFSNLCTCGIRYANFEDGMKVPAFGLQFQHEFDTCSTQQWKKRPLLLLALVLTELALACPVTVKLEPFHQSTSVLKFMLHGHGPGRKDPVMAHELLFRIEEGTSRRYRQAVRYCLDYDQDYIETQQTKKRFTSDFDGHIEHVVRPLYEYTRILAEHTESQRQLYARIRKLPDPLDG